MPQDPIESFISRARFNADGLIPAIAQQSDTREVLMMAWMDEAALRETLSTGRGVYFSRSRGERWAKGETSGNTQAVLEARLDCDADTILITVDQTGGACHTGDRTCFDADVLILDAGAR